VLRLAVLTVTLFFIGWIISRAKNPRTWAWISQGESADSAAVAATAPARHERTAPYPDAEVLAGAVDHQPFLVEHKDGFLTPPETRRDADARYHLLLLAHSAKPGALEADGASGYRYTALREKPNDYRGQLVTIQGDLLWITHLELKRDLPGLHVCYQALITANKPDQGYWCLFTDLPEGLPPPQEWDRLYLHGVRFTGYFYKVLKADLPKDNQKAKQIPVLIGKSLVLPMAAAESWSWLDMPYILAVMAVPVAMLGVFALVWHRRGERAHRKKMAEVEARRRQRIESVEFGSGPEA
jgi:hypothetical protein